MGKIELPIPYRFCGKEIHSLNELREAFLKKWDYGAAALKRGALTEYFKNVRDMENQDRWKKLYLYSKSFEKKMWNKKLHEDVVFARYLYYLLPEEAKQPNIPMDDMDVYTSTESYRVYPDLSSATEFERSYGSIAYNFKYKEENYINYISNEAKKELLAETYKGRKEEIDLAERYNEKEPCWPGCFSLDKVLWWQDYLREIGQFED